MKNSSNARGAVGAVFSALLAFGALARPAVAASSSFTLDRAVAEAIRTSDDLALAAKQVEIDRRQAGIDASRALPTLNANAAATHYDGASTVSLSSAGPQIELLRNHSEDLWFAVALPLDITGQVSASVRQARIQTAIDELALRLKQIAIVLRAKRTYYDVLRAEHRVHVAQSALDSAIAQQVLAAKLVAQEMGQKIDLHRADTQVAVAQQDLMRAQVGFDIARQVFNDLVGRPLADDVNLDETAGVSPTAPLSSKIDPSELVKDLDRAHSARPDLIAADLARRAAKIGVKLARTGLDPTVSINASTHYLPTTSFMMPRDRTADVTIMLNVPLYDGGATRDRVAVAKASEEQASISLDKATRSADLAVRQAYYNRASAAGQIGAANTALTEAEAARRLAQTRYEGQVGIYLEVTDSQSALVTAQNNQINAVYDYLIAGAQLEYEIGATEISK